MQEKLVRTILVAISVACLAFSGSPGTSNKAYAAEDKAKCLLPPGERHGVNYPPYCAGWDIVPSTHKDGDRREKVQRLYPEDAFYHAGKGGRILDVTKAPFNATGKGKTDDTAALVAAWDFVAEKLRKNPPNSPDAQYIIYLPAGTYLVSDTIIYSGDVLHPDDNTQEGQYIRFIGEGRFETQIRLRDYADGFGEGAMRPVVAFGRKEFNNLETKNAFRGITINTGRGNPGAIGLEFGGANANEVDDTTIYSLDGLGQIGLHIRIEASQVYLHDLTIAGFDYGISTEKYHVTMAAIEHATMWGQHIAAVHSVDSGLSIRKLASVNRGPAVLIEGAGAHAVVVESKLLGGDEGTAAIRADKGMLFVRDIETADYARAVDVAGVPEVIDHDVAEYVSGPTFTLFGTQPVRSLPLPVKDIPAAKKDWPKPKDWANVDAFGAVGDGVTDDSPAIQAAVDSGNSVVYFPKKSYLFTQAVTVPATVKRINLLYSTLQGATSAAILRIEEDSPVPLIIEDGYGGTGTTVVSAGPRGVILNHTGFIRYRNESAARPDLFINVSSALGPLVISNQNAWLRFANTEPKTVPPGKTPAAFSCEQNANLWVFGFKTETSMTAFDARSGCKLEILGGVANQTPFRNFPNTIYPVVRVENAQASAILHTSGFPTTGTFPPERQGYTYGVRAFLGGEEKAILYSQFPSRPGRPHNFFMPLYVDQL
ncbi:MAG: glycosyl hydrolase family 28-related protein [Rhodospirillales bacterium]